MAKTAKHKPIIAWVLGALAVALLSAACAQSAGAQQTTSEKDKEVAALKVQVAALEQDSRYWNELTATLKPVELRSMTDHRAYMLPSGTVIALHFDNLDLSKAEHLNWVALGVPGKFTPEDQARVEQQFGKGFTHFHDMKNDVHGGLPGSEGVWFVHVAGREFDSPMSGGHVKPGIDEKFMPTPPTE